MAIKKFRNKKAFKRLFKKCAFCNAQDYDILDVHRWRKQGKDGGKYSFENSIVACASCHRLIHSGKIEILNIHFSTIGYVVIFNQDGKEKINTLL